MARPRLRRDGGDMDGVDTKQARRGCTYGRGQVQLLLLLRALHSRITSGRVLCGCVGGDGAATLRATTPLARTVSPGGGSEERAGSTEAREAGRHTTTAAAPAPQTHHRHLLFLLHPQPLLLHLLLLPQLLTSTLSPDAFPTAQLPCPTSPSAAPQHPTVRCAASPRAASPSPLACTALLLGCCSSSLLVLLLPRFPPVLGCR